MALAEETREKLVTESEVISSFLAVFQGNDQTVQKNSKHLCHPTGTSPVVRQDTPVSSLGPFSSTKLVFKPFTEQQFH